MQIVGIYSFNKGKEMIYQHHSSELEEVLQIVKAIDAENCKAAVRQKETMKARLSYSPSILKEAFKEQFATRGWINHKAITQYSKDYYIPGYMPPIQSSKETFPFREMDFVKNQLGVGLQFGEYQDMVYDINAKMTIFAKLDVIDCGIEIVPVKGLADGMSTGVSYFEQFVWDLEHRGVSDIDIPVLIFGIDTDGIKPKDLKLAEVRQTYLFSDM